MSNLNVQALRLYREILRKSRQLKFTNKEYFRKTVRKDFEKSRDLEDPKEIKFQTKVYSRWSHPNVSAYYFYAFSESRTLYQHRPRRNKVDLRVIRQQGVLQTHEIFTFECLYLVKYNSFFIQ